MHFLIAAHTAGPSPKDCGLVHWLVCAYVASVFALAGVAVVVVAVVVAVVVVAVVVVAAAIVCTWWFVGVPEPRYNRDQGSSRLEQTQPRAVSSSCLAGGGTLCTAQA